MHFKIQFQGGFVYWLPVLAYETKTREFFLNMVKYHRIQNLQYGLAFRFLPNKLENDSGEGINLIDIPKAWWWEPRELLSCLTAISAFEEGLQEGTPSEKGRPWTTSEAMLSKASLLAFQHPFKLAALPTQNLTQFAKLLNKTTCVDPQLE